MCVHNNCKNEKSLSKYILISKISQKILKYNQSLLPRLRGHIHNTFICYSLKSLQLLLRALYLFLFVRVFIEDFNRI